MIMVEMAHDARIIPIDKDHRPDAWKPWLGDSVAHWDGDVLVVETRNLHPQQAPRNISALSDEGVVLEPCARLSAALVCCMIVLLLFGYVLTINFCLWIPLWIPSILYLCYINVITQPTCLSSSASPTCQ